MIPNAIFIPGNVPSLKNSKVKTAYGIFRSKTVTNYLRSLGIQDYSASKKTVKGYQNENRPNLFAKLKPEWDKLIKYSRPLYLGFYFVRDSRRDYDFNNCNQIVTDLLTAHDWIEDDSIRFLIPVFMGSKLDKDNPGVYLTTIDPKLLQLIDNI